MKHLVTISMCLCLAGCGGWLNQSRTTLLATNAGINGYDDVAVLVWKDAPTKPAQKEQLATSLCATLIAQDAVIQAWEITTAVDAGIAKKTDITPYAGAAITALDSLEDYLELGGVNVPEVLKMAIGYLEQMNPGGALPPDQDPLEQCADILAERYPSAGVPWGAIVSSGAELVLFILELIKDKDIPKEALEQHIRVHLKQGVLYESTLGGE